MRQAITAAAHQIDQGLRGDPESKGESRGGADRVWFVFPLGIRFEVDTMPSWTNSPSELGRLFRRHGASSAQLAQVSAEPRIVHDAALLEEIQKLVGGARGGHGDNDAGDELRLLVSGAARLGS